MTDESDRFQTAKACRLVLDEWGKRSKHYDPFKVPEEWAKLEYGRMLWKKPEHRERLMNHWTDHRHPYRDRFLSTYQAHVIRALDSDPANDEKLDEEFKKIGLSLRVIVKEIPPVFGSFY